MAIELDLDATLENYAVFGNPIKHSKSPHIHTLFAEQTGIDLAYQSIEVPKDGLDQYIRAFFSHSGKGLNITVPFKEQAWRICSVLTPRASKAASVNTLWSREDDICGDTTDGAGLVNDLIFNNGVEIGQRAILILGAGGAARAVLEPLCGERPGSITIANRTVARAETLAETFSDIIKVEGCAYTELVNKQFDLIINATSLSLTGELPSLPDSILDSGGCCYDLVYADKPTVFMQWGKAQGAIQVLDGLGMLVEQAAESFFIWHGVRPDTAPVLKALRS